MLTDLQTVVTATQRAQEQVQQGAIQAERLRGALALCDELLTPAPPPDPPTNA